MNDWIETLDRLDDIDAEMILPGHGNAQENEDYLHQVKALLEKTMADVAGSPSKRRDP